MGLVPDPSASADEDDEGELEELEELGEEELAGLSGFPSEDGGLSLFE